MIYHYRLHLGLLVLVAGIALLGWYLSLPKEKLLRISFLDVGQGDAIFVQTPGGYDLLIDGGRDDTVLSRLREHMPYFDKSIDMVIATHPDKDHSYGLLPAFDTYRIGTLMASRTPSDTTLDEDLLQKSESEPSPRLIPFRGQKIILDPRYGVILDILFPDQDTIGFKDTNEASIILRLTYGETEVMLTGDSPASVEQFLVNEYGNGLQSDILKLGHHGSKTSSAPLFLKAVSPQYGIVSAGENNTYNHPDPLIMKRVEAYGIETLSTINEGTITFVSDGKIIKLD